MRIKNSREAFETLDRISRTVDEIEIIERRMLRRREIALNLREERRRLAVLWSVSLISVCLIISSIL